VHSRPPTGRQLVAHQAEDGLHQDFDIDVVMTHIDANGDGTITRDEARSAAGSVVVWSLWSFPACAGCFGGAVFYLVLRVLFGALRPGPRPRHFPASPPAGREERAATPFETSDNGAKAPRRKQATFRTAGPSSAAAATAC